jgi:uncharacterized protein (DUF433 family)
MKGVIAKIFLLAAALTLQTGCGADETNSTAETKIAKAELFDLDHLSVGRVAPEIEGEDVDGKKLKASDYRGKVVMLSFRRAKSALAVVVIQSYCLIMLDWSKCAAVERIAGKVSGAWLFKGTRVPVAALFENLEDGATGDNFREWFPGVAREQVEAVLEHAEVKTWIASGKFLQRG